MAFSKLVSALVAMTFCSQVFAQEAATQIFMPPGGLANNNCGADVTSCRGQDYEIVTEYEGTPVYTTTSVMTTSTKTHTTTSTTIVPFVVTKVRSHVGICEMVDTTTVTTPQVITVTQTLTSIQHSVTGVVATSVSTYFQYVDDVSACIMTIPAPKFTIAVPPVNVNPVVDAGGAQVNESGEKPPTE